MPVKLKRAYEPPAADDGERYLVERLWPRGVSKQSLSVASWLRELAPSDELRRWYGHVVQRWPEFERRYRAELEAAGKQSSLKELAAQARTATVTFVFATRDEEHSGARVLKDVIDSLMD